MEEIALEEINLDDKENEEDKVFTDELIDLGYHKEMIDATIGVRRFFGITKEALAEKYHVFPDDSAETAFNKIMDVALEDKSLYKLFKKDPSVW